MNMVLDGFWWQVGAGVFVYVLGVFTSQWLKDKISGVPTELRQALSESETAAMTALNDARLRVIADVTSFFTPATPAPAPAPAPAVVAVQGAPVIVPVAPVMVPAPAVATVQPVTAASGVAHPYLPHEHHPEPTGATGASGPAAVVVAPGATVNVAPSIIQP